ncbi:hypothetical protein BWR19_10090 [Halomonas sp. 1513]|nr:type II toxin-antitoxin system RelE/ParE family toxin [Halomonas sp. 1513]APX93252.1 hypothetical protein BWR19_10090 [Halomonas sp. 1513]
MMAPSSIELDQTLRESIQRTAYATGHSADWIVSNAIEEYVAREQRAMAFQQATLMAWEEYQASGLHISADEMEQWLACWGTADAPPSVRRRSAVPQVMLAPPAVEYLQRLHERLLEQHPPQVAQQVAAVIVKSIRWLGDEPRYGRLMSCLGDEYRDWWIDFADSGYIARYRLDGNAVVVLSIRQQNECHLAASSLKPPYGHRASSGHKLKLMEW